MARSGGTGCGAPFWGGPFVLPVYRHKRLSDVRLDEKFMAKWKAACGDTVLDFGSGQGDEARMLRDAGIRVTEFEPYPACNNVVNREQGRASAMGFLSAVRAGTPFSAIFVSSVLNSVPFPEDREHILRIVAALCGPETLVCAAARGTKSSAWGWVQEGESLSQRASGPATSRCVWKKGVVLGDIATAPKTQKFFEQAEWLELWSRHFGSVEAGLSDGMVTVRCRKPLAWHPRDLAESLRFEFRSAVPGRAAYGACPTGPASLFHAPGAGPGGRMSQGKDWTFHGFAGEFDGHVREQLPWYELASAAMGADCPPVHSKRWQGL